MLKTSITALAFGMLLPVSAHGETLYTRLKFCIEGSLNDTQKDALIAELPDLRSTPWAFVEQNAPICFTKLTGQDAIYSKGYGLVIDPAAIDAIRFANEAINTANIITEAELNERARNAEKLRQEEKCDVLAKKKEAESLLAVHEETIENALDAIQEKKVEVRLTTIAECNYWVEDDLRGAVTNPICQKVFEEFGLPNSEIIGPSADSVLAAQVSRDLLEKDIAALNDALNAISKEEAFVQKHSELELQKLNLATSAQLLAASAQADLLPAPKTLKPVDDGC